MVEKIGVLDDGCCFSDFFGPGALSGIRCLGMPS